MTRWYSARGARRGMKMSAFAGALWLLWAAGYVQGSSPATPPEKAGPAVQQLRCCFAGPQA